MDPPALQGPPVLKVLKVLLAFKATRVCPDLLARLVPQVPPAQQDLEVAKATKDIPALRAPPAQLALLALEDLRATRAPPAKQAQQEQRVPVDPEVIPAQVDQQVRKVPWVLRVKKAQADPPVLRAPPAH